MSRVFALAHLPSGVFTANAAWLICAVMAFVKAKGRLRGKKPKLTPRQEAHLVSLARAGEHTTLEVAELFNIGRSTV